MRTAPMCTAFRVPRCSVYSWVNIWRNGFGSLNKECKVGHNFRLLGSSVCEQGGNNKWSRRPISTNSEGRSKNVSSVANIRHGITDEMVTKVTTNINIKKADDSKLEPIQCIDFRKLVAENKDLAELATFIVFDIETTGLDRRVESIIEIALLDIHGGENSTFQTLVNPGCTVPNSSVHGITTQMVRKPGVPSMAELIPILLQFVRSRQKPGGFVIFVAHNARAFDVPFMVKEFTRCNVEMPPNWGFLDTLPLGREQVKSRGEKARGKVSLQALREHYQIELEGSAHRAMSDVLALTRVFQKLSFDMKLTRGDLIQRLFTASELNSSSAKEKKDTSKKS